MPDYPFPPAWVLRRLREGQVINAHPLALTSSRKLDERRQRALTRYYHAAGVGGMAVGVHTTQFRIRDAQHGLLKPVLQLAAETIAARDAREQRATLRVAGICGLTGQAVKEAALVRELGYHAGLLSLGALTGQGDEEMIAHCEAVARETPLFGFYLQPAAGGRRLSHAFWRRFAEIPNVIAIKVAPFNRYQTFDVIRAVAESGRANEIALYTGNDDNILIDLLTQFTAPTGRGETRLGIAGGLLGHWACWTRRAVELLSDCKRWRGLETLPARLLTLAAQITDCNAAFFDAANQFAGCIPGIHEVLRRQGLLEGAWCLDPHESLSPGQADEIERVHRAYPHLNDDQFVQEHRDEWLS
ncbi:MAG: dihydrodipicolinate synthase family protein [Verrucomicrobia bacterium]|nr:dihydrodipicolinate synthase family protein [Verrucomicrobiota bacterium]